MDENWGYPLRKPPYIPRPGKRLQFAIEHGPVEIVDLPIKHVDFP